MKRLFSICVLVAMACTPKPAAHPTTMAAHEAVSTGQADAKCGAIASTVRTGSGAGDCVSTRDASGTVRHIHCDDKKGNSADWTCEGAAPSCHTNGLGTCK
jgi:hypothetical protein